MIIRHAHKAFTTMGLASGRSIHISRFDLSSVKNTPLYTLRQRTGLAYNLCREALDKHGDDVERAATWLEAQAMVLGLQKATKVRGRSAREGLIGLAIDQNKKLITTLELNCETDFVAKNQVFKNFTLDLIAKFASTIKDCAVSDIPNQIHVQELEPTEKVLDEINSQIPPLISKLGENIKVERARHYLAINDSTHLFGQVHAKADQRRVGSIDIIVGRFGAMVGLKQSNSSSEIPLEAIGSSLCRHVIGFNPKYIELPDALRDQLEKAEKEKIKNKLAESNEERLEHEADEYELSDEEESTEINRDEWPSMMDQTLITSEDQTVRDFCAESGVSVVFFKRIECGECQ